MEERTGIVTVEGDPLTLVGPEIRVGEEAPDFAALNGGLNPVGLSELPGKVRVLFSVPSLDTPVCDTETRKFSEELGRLGPEVAGVALSTDLPFAQQRWCGAAGIHNVRTLSDHRDLAFGRAYGVLIRELRLLARAVFVIDRENRVRHVELVSDLTREPDYEAALAAVRRLL